MKPGAALLAALILGPLSLTGCSVTRPLREQSQPADLAWMQGCWRGERAFERWRLEEGALVGEGEILLRTGWAPSERMRIARDEAGLALFAQPAGAAEETRFGLTIRGDADATFENPAHDAPKAIRYALMEGRLRAWAGDPPALAPAFDGAPAPCEH